MAMAMACNYTRPRKLSLSCRTRTFQALILSTAVFLAASASTAVVVGMEPQPPSSGGCRHYRFELTHVDANLNLSSDELMRRAYDRSRLRAATLYGTATDSDDSDARHEGHLSIRDTSYVIKFYLDNQEPKDNISAVVDTGSNIIWTTEAECKRSTTRSMLPCCSPKCEQRANCGCRSTNRRSELKAEAEKCTYAIKYGGNDKENTKGVLYEDKLTIVAVASKAVPSSQSFEKVAIGCSTSTGLEFKDPSIKVKGIFGLGRSATSLPRQLNFNKFSYCLSSYQKPDLPSYLLLTAAPDMATGAKGGAAVATTGLQPNNEYKTRYFVDLQGISIGGTRLPVSMQSGGNMFVDTGTSFTKLEGAVFAKLVAELDRVMNDTKYAKEQPGRNNGKICYSPSTTADESSKLPDMVLHFAGSADMVLPWDSYLWKTTSKLCLAISKSTIKGGISVLGNFQMQNIHMLLDTENEKLSFVPADCSKV